LVRAGHRVLEATDASEARAQLALELPDIILMDIGLPGEDGLSLTRDLKSRSELVDIPIVAVTAHAMKNDLDQAQAAGCAGTLLKPYSPRQLVELVAEHRRKPAGKDA
jgi:CheY-like chemotaxis protein